MNRVCDTALVQEANAATVWSAGMIQLLGTLPAAGIQCNSKQPLATC